MPEPFCVLHSGLGFGHVWACGGKIIQAMWPSRGKYVRQAIGHASGSVFHNMIYSSTSTLRLGSLSVSVIGQLKKRYTCVMVQTS